MTVKNPTATWNLYSSTCNQFKRSVAINELDSQKHQDREGRMRGEKFLSYSP